MAAVDLVGAEEEEAAAVQVASSVAGREVRADLSLSSLNSSDQSALLNANSTVLTDLSKLGPAGTQFTYDFFVPGTLITFPSQAVQVAESVKGVSSAVPGLSLQALHETGTVPKITATFQLAVRRSPKQ